MKLIRLFRWRLKTLLLLTAFLAALLALWIQLIVPYQQQRLARESLESLAIEMTSVPGSPQWLTRFGPDTFVRVVEMRSRSSRVNDDTIAPIADMPFVRRLYFNRTNLSDQGLRYFGNLKRLQRLSLWGTRISDEGIASLTNCRELVALDVHETGVTDRGLELLVGLPKLRELIVGDAVQGPGLAAVAKMPALERLDLSRTGIHFDSLGLLAGSPLGELKLADWLPARVCNALAQLPNLRTYHGQLVHADDQTAQTLAKCTRLQTANLAGVGLSDEATKTLTKLPKLRQLILHGALTDKTLLTIQSAHQLKSVQLAGRFSLPAIEQLAIQRPQLSIEIKTVGVDGYVPPPRFGKLKVESLIHRIDFGHSHQRAFIHWPATLQDFNALDSEIRLGVDRIEFRDSPTIRSGFRSQHQRDWSLNGIDQLTGIRAMTIPRVAPGDLPRLAELPSAEGIILTDDLLTDRELDSVRLPPACKSFVMTACPVSREGLERIRARYPDVKIRVNGHGSIVHDHRWQTAFSGQGSIADIMRFPDAEAIQLQDVNSTLDFSPLAEHRNLTSIAIFGFIDNAPIWTQDRDLPSIKFLSCPMRAFNDAQMSQLARMPNLEFLTLHNSIITDAGLATLQHTPRLKYLRLNTEHITGSGLRYLATCQQLQHLHLHSSLLKDRNFAHLAKLSSLTEIQIRASDVGDEACDYFAQVPNLRSLQIWKSQITDEGLASLGKCPNLTTLLITAPAITVDGLWKIAKCKSLRLISMGGTSKITSADIDKVQSLYPHLEIN